MARLVVNPDTEMAWEIPLQPGTVTLGRGAESHFPIEHESVSSSHCEITLAAGRTILKDLGSVSGTFVDGELVEQAVLQPGQRIRLGEVEMVFEPQAKASPEGKPKPQVRIVNRTPADAPGLVVTPVQAMVASAGGDVRCKFHPRIPARFVCTECGQPVCELCVNMREGTERTQKFCRSCGAPCAAVTQKAVDHGRQPRSFSQEAARAFSYPFAGDGVMLLVGGTILYSLIGGVAGVARYGLFIGVLALGFLSIFGTGYLFSYLRRIVSATATGEDTMPDWPDFSEIGEDIMSPFLQFVGTVLVCFLPAIVVSFAMDRNEPLTLWAEAAAVLYGFAYFPMAFLAVAMFDSLAALNPMLIVPSMLKVPLDYLLTSAVFVGVLIVRWAGYRAMSFILPEIVASVLLNFISLYFAIVGMRILGMLYRLNSQRLGWFSRRIV
jgi:hypothetical protein